MSNGGPSHSMHHTDMRLTFTVTTRSIYHVVVTLLQVAPFRSLRISEGTTKSTRSSQVANSKAICVEIIQTCLKQTDIMDATEDRRTLLNLMGTRRSLNAIGARIIVRNPLDFSDLEPSSTDSFVKFMGRHQSLFKHIKDISIHVSSRDGDPSSTTLLLSLLDHATRLVDLKLQMLIPSFVDFTSPLSLSSLQHLFLNDLHTAAPLLKNLQAPLKTLRLYYINGFRHDSDSEDDSDDDIEFSNPIPLLVNFCNTLESLDVLGLRFNFVNPPPPIVFPRLRTFDSTDQIFPDLASLIVAFPKLEVLRFCCTSPLTEFRTAAWDRNLDQQNELVLQGYALWPELDVLSGDPILLASLRLSCKVIRMFIEYVGPSYRDICILLLSETLPNILDIYVVNEPGKIFEEAILFAYVGLTHLTVRLSKLSKTTTPSDMDILMTDFVESLRVTTTLSYVLLSLEWPRTLREMTSKTRQIFDEGEQKTNIFPDPLSEYLVDHMDYKTLARRMVDAAPTLDYIIINTRSCDSHPTIKGPSPRGWRVSGQEFEGEHTSSLVELSKVEINNLHEQQQGCTRTFLRPRLMSRILDNIRQIIH
ncbi:hypothetical protein C8Q75DRAFT_221897 [Abortiporus biennis]|nr:hypothetical protein C8Q75DRAFT_221897 [Abortiporus biennis]